MGVFLLFFVSVILFLLYIYSNFLLLIHRMGNFTFTRRSCNKSVGAFNLLAFFVCIVFVGIGYATGALSWLGWIVWVGGNVNV